jgi:hypothetical protein
MVSAAVAVLLVLALAMPASATTSSGDAVGNRLDLPVSLTSTTTPAPWFNSGVVAGRLGGVPVVGSFAGTSALGIITLTVHRATFAYGTYACFRKGCSFYGLLAGVRVKGIALPFNLQGVTRAVADVFPNRRAWVAAVADWARRHLSPGAQGKIVAEAAGIPGS